MISEDYDSKFVGQKRDKKRFRLQIFVYDLFYVKFSSVQLIVVWD